ncbi:MAG: hypothetical protein GY863_07765 [bacterium]|nr:hypothetical protein [bacterium]
MKEFLYKIIASRPELLVTGPTPQEETILNDHFNYLKDLSDKGIVIIFGRTQNTDPSAFGIVIFIAETGEKAKEIMLEDPAVKEGIMTAELFPYKVAGLQK